MLRIQILIVLFIIYALINVFRRFRKGELGRRAVILWVLLWCAIGAAVVLPQTTQFVAELLGVGRGVDVVVYLSIVTLFYLQYRTFARLEKMERSMTTLVRASGLKDFEKAFLKKI